LVLRTDGAFGDPLQWVGASPPPAPAKMVPNVRFSIETPVAVTPTVSGSFTDGLWAGDISLLGAATNVMLVALDNLGHVGRSSPFQVLAAPSGGLPAV